MLSHFAKLIRWQNLLIVAVTQCMVALLLIPNNTIIDILMDIDFEILVLSTVLITAGGYLINDYYDIKIDYVNKPERVVAGRYIKRHHILFIHIFLSVLGILGGTYVSPKIGAINLLAAGLLWLYSNQLKRLPFWGNLSVAALTGLSVYIIYIYYHKSFFLISSYAAFAFFMSLIREIIKDLEDIKGDRVFGCRTLPIAYGVRNTKSIIYLLSALFLLVVSYFLRQEPKFYFVFSGLFLILSVLNFKIYKADKIIDYKKLSRMSKIIMLIGMLSMLMFL